MTTENQPINRSNETDNSVDERALEVGTEMLKGSIKSPGPLQVEALAIAAATEAGKHNPVTDSADEALQKCLVRTVTEAAETLKVSDGPESAGVGTTVDYVDAFFDSEGNKVGTMTGKAIVLAMTPHMWQFHRSLTEFADGSIEHDGVVDCTALMYQMTQIHRIVGKSGVYEGRRGYMAFEASDPTKKPPHFSVTFLLC